MINLIAAALAAAAPASSAPDAHAQPQQAHPAEHKEKDCCKDCCKDMDAKHADHAGEHGHPPQ